MKENYCPECKEVRNPGAKKCACGYIFEEEKSQPKFQKCEMCEKEGNVPVGFKYPDGTREVKWYCEQHSIRFHQPRRRSYSLSNKGHPNCNSK